jgi:serine/threonine protein kinase
MDVPASDHDEYATQAQEATVLAGPGIPSFPSVPGYRILAEIGRGGMGVVYRALQVGANREVALKMILSGDHAGSAEIARSGSRRRRSPGCSIRISSPFTRSANMQGCRSSAWSIAPKDRSRHSPVGVPLLLKKRARRC